MTDYNPHFVKKVYCKNCSMIWGYLGYSKVCTAYDKFLAPKVIKEGKPNGCKHYKRKWWKVWVR